MDLLGLARRDQMRSADTYKPIYPGETSQRVYELQGFLGADRTGTWDKQSIALLRKYQETVGLPVDGICSQELLVKIVQTEEKEYLSR